MKDISFWLNRLDKYLSLKDNWDGFGSLKPSIKTIVRAQRFVRDMDALGHEILNVALGGDDYIPITYLMRHNDSAQRRCELVYATKSIELYEGQEMIHPERERILRSWSYHAQGIKSQIVHHILSHYLPSDEDKIPCCFARDLVVKDEFCVENIMKALMNTGYVMKVEIIPIEQVIADDSNEPEPESVTSLAEKILLTMCGNPGLINDKDPCDLDVLTSNLPSIARRMAEDFIGGAGLKYSLSTTTTSCSDER